MKWWEGNVFIGVCLSMCGVSLVQVPFEGVDISGVWLCPSREWICPSKHGTRGGTICPGVGTHTRTGSTHPTGMLSCSKFQFPS